MKRIKLIALFCLVCVSFCALLSCENNINVEKQYLNRSDLTNHIDDFDTSFGKALYLTTVASTKAADVYVQNGLKVEPDLSVKVIGTKGCNSFF